MSLRSLAKTVAFLTFLIIVTSPLALAQFNSAVEGTVTDQAGAAVPDAQVVLLNVATGVSQTTQSNAEGYYRFPSLPPGTYQVTASAKDFVSVTQENIALGASEVRTIPLALKVGRPTEQVTITAEPPPLQKTEAKIGQDLSSREVAGLPLAGRNIFNLISLSPGVTGIGNLTDTAGGTDVFALVGNPSINANGQRGDGNAFYIDGTSANSNPDPGTFNVTPNPESIAEFTVAVNDYSAEHGRSGSLVIQAVTKSGTNEFHGSAFEYHQDNKLTARNVFQNTPDPLTGRILPVSRRNEFGGAVGGPIQKDKMFFFFSYDQLISSQATSNLITLETPQFVDFMKSHFPNNISTFLLTKFPAQNSGFQSFQTVADLSPGCSGNGPLGMPCGLPLLGTGLFNVAAPRNGRQWSIRVDRYFRNSLDRIYVNFDRRTQDSAGTGARPAFNTDSTPAVTYPSVNWTHTINATAVNEAAMGFTRIDGNSDCKNCQVPPIATPNGLVGFGNGFAPALFIQNDYHWRDLLTVNRGRHTLKAGADIFRDQENDLFSGPQQRPTYTFLNLFDFAADKPLQELGINFDLRNGGPAFQDIQYRTTTYGFFVQDDYKVKSNLSVNMGIRWDFSSNPNEKNGRFSNITLGSGSTFQQQIADASIGVVPALLKTHRIGYFAPRLGFAWAPTAFHDKLSVRGGLGVFMDRWPNIIWSDATRFNPPFQSSITADTRVPSGPQPVYGFCGLTTTPFDCLVPPGLPIGVNSHGGPIGAVASIGGTAPDLRYAYSVSRFFGIQYAFGSNWILEADYVGSHDVHLYTVTDRNRFAGDVTSDGVLNRLNPFFSSINYADNSGWSNHNGATFSVNKRFSHGLTAQTTFAIGKTVSVSDAPGPGRDSSLSPIVDAYNINAQKGLASFDIPKSLSFFLLYSTPRPHTGSELVNGFLGGWELASTAHFQSGYPFWVVNQGVDYNGDGNFFDRPNAPAFGNSKHCDRSDFLNGCLNAADFPAPAPGTSGSLGRNTFRGPGLANVDFSFLRSFHMPWFVGTEGSHLKIRAEIYNLFNRVNLMNPTVTGGNDLSNGLFGHSGAAFNPRTLQLSAKIEF